MKLSVTFELTESQIIQLADKAPKLGFLREHPQRSWKLAERKEAARFVLQALAEKMSKG